MADKDGPPIAPGQVYIEVEYDYEYKAKDKMVAIRQGECYMLVRKTNEDWWQVRKEEGTKAFYVPAQYVREVRRALMPPQKPTLRAKPTVLDIRRASDENLNRPQPEMSSFGRPSPSSTPSPSSDRVSPPALSKDANQNLGSPHHCKMVAELVLLHNNNNHHHANNSTLPRTRADSPPLKVGNNHNKSPDSDKTSPLSNPPGDRLNKLHNDSESGDELSSSSTELMQPLSSEENCHSTHSSQSDSQYGSPPRGWSEELDEHGHTLYISEHTQEKWIKHVDEQGRPYYYSADGSRSEWELPKYNMSPLSGEVPKSRSLERKQQDPIVLTKWRHSTYVLDLNDKECAPAPKQSPPDSDSCPSSPKHPSTPSEKCGVLNVTKITENGKKVRKNWTSSWTVLQGYSLLFAKGQGAAPAGYVSISLFFSICTIFVLFLSSSFLHIHLSSCHLCCEMSSSVPLLSFLKSYYRSGSIPELLLTLLSNWKRSVKPRPAVSYVNCRPVQAAAKFGGNQSKPEFTVDLRGGSVDWASKDKSSKKHVIELKTRQGTDLLIQSEIDSVINDWYRALTETINTHSPGAEKQDKEKDHRDSKKNRVMKTSVSMDSSDQKKTRLKLKKFLTRRPTYQAVRDKGYIKDQVFGCSLTSLSIDGLYRVSGNLAVIQKLRFAVNHDETLDLNDSKWEDIHVCTGALKMFFRELPEPLFTYGSFEDFVEAIKSSDYNQRVNSIKDLINKLPKPNHDTMQGLFEHLRSVAIVFGPTLLRPETETGNIAVHMVYQNQIVELILLEYESIFGRSGPLRLAGLHQPPGAEDLSPLSSEENCHSTHSSQSDSQYGSPPRGWSEELDEHGHTLYISEHTQEKWIKHVDEQGRPYYYSADGSRSEWELPKYNMSPLSGEVPKSRSLERKQQDPIVLTKWRHSTYVLDLNDKECAPAPKQSPPDSDSCPSSPKHPSTPSEKCGVLNVTKITENGKKVRKNWTSSWTVLQGYSLLFAKGQGAAPAGYVSISLFFSICTIFVLFLSSSFLHIHLSSCHLCCEMSSSVPLLSFLKSYYRSGSIPELLLTLLSNWKRSVKPRPAVSYVNCRPVQAAAKFGGNQSKPEFTVDLRGGSVDWASKDKSSKKHVIELKTRQGTDLLIQSEIDSVINDWYRALTETINTHEDMPESPGAEKQDKEKDHRDSKKNRVMKTSVSMDSSDQKKTRLKLKKFLTRRPTYQAVRDKGYIKGVWLQSDQSVPEGEHIGLSIDGLYRVSGNLAVIQKLRFAVNHDETLDLNDSKWEDIHVCTGALKMFFRELPEPLFTYGSFEDFVEAIKSSDYNQRVNSIKDLINKLPKPNHDTMQGLFEHLRRVIDHGEANRMTTQSVAIVFGPTLLRPETETGNIAVHMVYQNQIVELILLEYESIFG
ncbi:hypothetical protein F7725_028722, partial [Dissostichus mawsoni]